MISDSSNIQNFISDKSRRILKQFLAISKRKDIDFQKKYQQKYLQYNLKLQEKEMSKSSSSLKSVASISKCQSFQGKAYFYSDLNKKIQHHLQNNRMITKIYVYESPLNSLESAKETITEGFKAIAQYPLLLINNKIPDAAFFAGPVAGLTSFAGITIAGIAGPAVVLTPYAGIAIANEIIKHHQIIFEIQQMVYVLLSFGQDGLQCGIHGELEPLVERRTKNIKILQFQTLIQGRRIRDFLIEKQNDVYHLLVWNCQHFCDALLKALQ